MCWEKSFVIVLNICVYMSRVTRKCTLRSLSLSYPRKDWRAGSRQFFFGYDTDYKIALFCFQRLHSVVGVIPKEGFWGPARQSFFWYDNDKDLKAHFLMTQLSYVIVRRSRHNDWSSVCSGRFLCFEWDGHYSHQWRWQSTNPGRKFISYLYPWFLPLRDHITISQCFFQP